jgi:hypothetical protein
LKHHLRDVAWLVGLFGKCELGILQQFVAFEVIALRAAGDQVFPALFATFAFWHHMIKCEMP